MLKVLLDLATLQNKNFGKYFFYVNINQFKNHFVRRFDNPIIPNHVIMFVLPEWKYRKQVIEKW